MWFAQSLPGKTLPNDTIYAKIANFAASVTENAPATTGLSLPAETAYACDCPNGQQSRASDHTNETNWSRRKETCTDPTWGGFD